VGSELTRAALRRTQRRRPLLWLAALAAAAVWLGDGAWLAGGVLALGLAGLLALAGSWRLLMAGLLIAAALGGWHARDVVAREARRAWVGEGRAGEVVGRLRDEPFVQGRGWAGEVGLEGGGGVWLRGPGAAPEVGAPVRARGRFEPVAAPRNPGQFDRRGWLDRRGVFAELRARGAAERGPPPAWRRLGERVRAGFREAVTRGLDPDSREAAVIRAVVLGEHPPDDGLIEPFRRSGTLHVFAVSGLHVGMVALCGWLVLRALGVSRRRAVLPLLLLMFGYAWLTGLKPPAVRAAWMGTIVLGAFWFRRRPDLLNALGLAALVALAIDADMLFQAGVQLSFGVVAAIGLLFRPVSRAFAWIAREEAYLPRALYGPWRERWLLVRRRTAEALSVSTAAWLGSAPLIGWHFGWFTPVAIVASSVLSLLVFPLLGIALLAAVLSPLPWLPERINRLNGGIAGAVFEVAEVGAALPGGHRTIARDRPGGEFLLVYDLADDGAACWSDGRGAVLFDGGSRWSFEQVVEPSLQRFALRPDAFVASHPDGGHLGGLAPAMDRFPIRQGLVPVLRARSPGHRELLAAAGSRGIPLRRGRVGERYLLGEESWIEVLHEPDPWNWNALADQRVMVFRLHWRGWRVLFTGDAGWGTERELLESGRDVGADLVVAGRHARDSSLGPGFLEAVAPRAIIAGHAGFPPEERVPEDWRRACEARGIAVIHQGESGAVTATLEDGALVLRGFVDGRELRLPKAGVNGSGD